MALRWKKNPLPRGLARIGCGPQGSTLSDGEQMYATTGYFDGRFIKDRKTGWYWVAGCGSGVPHKNTCYEPVEDEATAKAEAMAYVKQHRAAALARKDGAE